MSQIHLEFFSMFNEALRNSIPYKTTVIPKGMTFDDFTPIITEESLAGSFPTSCNLNSFMPDVITQVGNTCVGCAVTNAIQFRYMNTLDQPFNLLRSILFIYYNARVYEDTTNADSGCFVVDAVKGITEIGACNYTYWPFVESNITVKPPLTAYEDASNFNQIFETRQINQDLNSIKTALCIQQYPVICGINVYSSWNALSTIETGNIPYPLPTETYVGAHCLLLTGYDDSLQLFNVQNSYGTPWGVHGYGTIPYKYILNITLAPFDELWIIGNNVNNLL